MRLRRETIACVIGGAVIAVVFVALVVERRYSADEIDLENRLNVRERDEVSSITKEPVAPPDLTYDATSNSTREAAISRTSQPKTLDGQSTTKAASGLPGGDSMLARALWGFRRKAPDAKSVLKNSYFNPGSKALKSSDADTLNAILKEIIAEEKMMYTEYAAARTAYANERVKNGAFELRLPGQEGRNQARPQHAEEEVSVVISSTHGECIVRIPWGASPELDSQRIRLLDVNTINVERVRSYVLALAE